jgi:hypothetical protein
MEENKEASSPAMTHPEPRRDFRPSDVEVFLGMLPAIAGSLATKHTDARTVRDLAIGLAREVTGQLVSLGICARTTTCLDGQYLATPGPAIAMSQPAGIINSQPASVLGSNGAKTQFPTQEHVKIPTL